MKLRDVVKMIPASQDVMIKWGARKVLFSGKCSKAIMSEATQYYDCEVAVLLAVGNTLVVRIMAGIITEVDA